jgi:hypothetical protein
MIAQIFIIIFGVTAAWLTQQNNENLKKYACIFGVLSQPFWFYSAWQSQQWGVFGLSFVYSVVWLLGLKNYWLTKPPPKEPHDYCECEAPKPVALSRCNECEYSTLLTELETIRRSEMKNKATMNRAVFIKRQNHATQ